MTPPLLPSKRQLLHSIYTRVALVAVVIVVVVVVVAGGASTTKFPFSSLGGSEGSGSATDKGSSSDTVTARSYLTPAETGIEKTSKW